MIRLSDTQYEALKKRVADGRLFLHDKWASTDLEAKEWIRLWQQLADQLFDQECIRGNLREVTPHEELLASAEAKVEKIRQLLISRGIIKSRERRKKNHVSSKSEERSLFESF